MIASRHGCLFFVVILCPVAALSSEPEDPLEVANSRTVELLYHADPVDLLIDRAELWSTSNGGQDWDLQAVSTTPQPGIRFHAQEDGIYGFYFVLQNQAGRSSEPPIAGTKPQLRVLIDTASPLVQIHQARIIESDQTAETILAVSWTAYDDHLEDRPISLYYRTNKQPRWRPIATAIRNIGRFDWAVPTDLSGFLAVKVEVVDRAGNISLDVSQELVVLPSSTSGPAPAAQALPSEPTARPQSAGTVAGAASDIIDAKRIAEAEQLHELGLWHKRRGDYGLAVERLIESLQYNPNLIEPAHELADIYYTEGNHQGALDIHQTILSRLPNDRDSLRGSALAWVALGKYPEAQASLEQVLRNDSVDAQTWLDAGDIFVWMGRRDRARTYWKKAQSLSDNNADVRAGASRRLNKLLPQEQESESVEEARP